MITINGEESTPLYLQIYEQYRKKIITGELKSGAKLISIQSLASSLDVSKNTANLAYQQLCSEGYIFSKPKSGYFVQKFDHDMLTSIKTLENKLTRDVRKGERNQENSFEREGMYRKDIAEGKEEDNYKIKYDFQYGDLDKSVFPIKVWRNISNYFLSSPNEGFMGTYSELKGEALLRGEVANYLRMYRGVSCEVEQVMICSGTQQALTIICQLLRTFSEELAFEDPGYDGARDIFRNSGLNVSPIPVKSSGIELERLIESKAKIVYITPSHQFPTGTIMPIKERMKLLEWAEKSDAIIIEDDYDSELRYVGKPIPSLQSIDSNNRVIYMGTFSKSLSPALRMSYMVLPKPLLKRYMFSFSKYVAHAPWLEQKILEKFIQDGHWERHLRKVNLSYKKKHDVLITSISKIMGNDKVKVHGKNAGMHILLEVNNGDVEEALIKKAANFGVAVYPVSQYWIESERYSNNMVLMGFSGILEEDIPEGVRLLKEAWF